MNFLVFEETGYYRRQSVPVDVSESERGVTGHGTVTRPKDVPPQDVEGTERRGSRDDTFWSLRYEYRCSFEETWTG